MIATWLVEIYLSKCNALEDGQSPPPSDLAFLWPRNAHHMSLIRFWPAVVAAEAAAQDVESLKLERTMVEDELKQLLVDYQVRPPLVIHSDCSRC